jgi:hypothetical protein
MLAGRRRPRNSADTMAPPAIRFRHRGVPLP